MSVSHFPNGLTNSRSGDPFNSLGVPDPTKYHIFFDDFDRFAAAEWTITTTEAGAGAASEALTDEDGGVLLITNDNADNDADFFQKIGESFLCQAGKELFFKARFKVSDATESDFVIGLQITDTAPLDVTDGIFFQKDDGDANLDFHVEKNNTASSAAAVATVVSDAYLTVAFHYDGKSKVKAFVNDVGVASLPVTNLPDDEVLTVSFGIQNGEAAAKTMHLDYIFVAKSR